MIGYFLAFLTAIFESLKAILSKQRLKTFDEYFIAWAFKFVAMLILFPLLFVIKIPNLNLIFLKSLFLIAVLNSLSTIFYMKAIKASDLSITVPITAFSPVFLLITAPIIINEFPSPTGLLGVLLIVAGTYLLKLQERHQSFLAPFKALFKEAGPKFMLVTVFIWSLESNIHKIGINNSSPIFWTIASNTAIAIALSFLLIKKSSTQLKPLLSQWSSIVPIGLVSGLGQLAQMTSFKYILAVYSIAIKRTSILLTILLSFLFFKEKNIKQRFIASLIIVLGALIITFYH